MKIKDLPKVIKKKAMVYIRENYPHKKHRPSKLINSFDWLETEEGSRYWELVNDGDFLRAENLLLGRLKVENPLLYKINQLNEDACWTGTSTAYVKESPFFLDEVLDMQVSNEEVVPYKKELEVIDPIVEAVREKLRQRSAVGIKKYGTTLAENNTDDFLNHLQEELMDGILYIEKLKNK